METSPSASVTNKLIVNVSNEFGAVNVNYDGENNLISGQLEVMMDCQFNVSNFEIIISDFVEDDTLPPIIDDFNIMQSSGGTAIDSLFTIELENVFSSSFFLFFSCCCWGGVMFFVISKWLPKPSKFEQNRPLKCPFCRCFPRRHFR